MKKMRILFYTMGCRLNQAEADNYQEELSKKGFLIVNKKPFDVAVVNSCSVTHKADREARQAIRKLKKLQPSAKIILTGCADIKLPEVDYYIKDKEKFIEKFSRIFIIAEKIKKQNNIIQRTRANIKIQTGCDNHCTYCYTRIARGKSKSINSRIIIQQIKNKEKQNIKEIVLTGVNIGQYQYGNLNLVDLINKILQETTVPRIRLSSINPEYVAKNKKFQKLFANPRLCQHLHLSLQSGSNSVLKRMNRRYSAAQYLGIIKQYYRVYPLFGFTTDVIVGFPGETEKEFKQTCDFVKKCGFLKIHIFRYSIRNGTPAAIMPLQVAENIKKQRSKILDIINLDLMQKFAKKMRGKKLSVLFEKKITNNWQGHAGNYFLINQKAEADLDNIIIDIIY